MLITYMWYSTVVYYVVDNKRVNKFVRMLINLGRG